MRLLDELAQRLPVELLEALVEELRAREGDGYTGQGALVLHFRGGHVLTGKAGKLREISALTLTQ